MSHFDNFSKGVEPIHPLLECPPENFFIRIRRFRVAILESRSARFRSLERSAPRRKFMAELHFIGGEKGGVGKSLVARVLAQFFIDHEIPFLGFDSDRSHGALLRFYSGYASSVLVDSYEAMDTILESSLEHPEKRILVDLAAQTHEPLTRWMEESGVLELAEENELKLTYWHVMDSGRDSVDLLSKLFERFDNRLDYVVVFNQIRGNKFTIFENSEVALRAPELGARAITLKRLHEPVMTKIDSKSASFWAATHNRPGEPNALRLLERQRTKVWLRHAYEEIKRIGIERRSKAN